MAYLKAILYYTPSNVVNNEDLQKSLTDVDVEKIAKQVGADLFKIEPENPYPTNYTECIEEAKSKIREKQLSSNPIQNENNISII